MRITKVFGSFQLFGCIGVMMTEEELADMVEVGKDFVIHFFKAFQDADRDGSGSMDFQEFVEMMIKVWMNDSYHNFQYDHGHSVVFQFQENSN